MKKVCFNTQEVLVVDALTEKRIVFLMTAKRPDLGLALNMDTQPNLDLSKYQPGDIIRCWSNDGLLGVNSYHAYPDSTPAERLGNVAEFCQKYLEPMLAKKFVAQELEEKNSNQIRSASFNVVRTVLAVCREGSFTAKQDKDLEPILHRIQADEKDLCKAMNGQTLGPGARNKISDKIMKGVQALGQAINGREHELAELSGSVQQSKLDDFLMQGQ